MTGSGRPSCPIAARTVDANSRSTMMAFASPWFSMKAIDPASSRVLSAFSTATRHRNAVVRLDHLWRVRQHHGHGVAAPDAKSRQRMGQPARARVDLAPACDESASHRCHERRPSGPGTPSRCARRNRAATAPRSSQDSGPARCRRSCSAFLFSSARAELLVRAQPGRPKGAHLIPIVAGARATAQRSRTPATPHNCASAFTCAPTLRASALRLYPPSSVLTIRPSPNSAATSISRWVM